MPSEIFLDRFARTWLIAIACGLTGCSGVPQLVPRLDPYVSPEDLVSRSHQIVLGEVRQVRIVDTITNYEARGFPLQLERVTLDVKETLQGQGHKGSVDFFVFRIPDKDVMLGPSQSRSVFLPGQMKIVFLQIESGVRRAVVDVIQSEVTVCSVAALDKLPPEAERTTKWLVAYTMLRKGPGCSPVMFAGRTTTIVPFVARLVGPAAAQELLHDLLSDSDTIIASSTCLALARIESKRHLCLARVLSVMSPDHSLRREAEELWSRPEYPR